MGIVYRVEFPDGLFYIGATINLKNRIAQHHCRSSNKKLKEKIDEFRMPKSEFDKLFTVIHDGDDFKEVERDVIQYEGENKLCINMIGKWGPSKKGGTITIYVPVDDLYLLPEIKEEAKRLGIGFGKYLVGLHIESKKGRKS